MWENGNCVKSGQTWFFCMMLPVGVVLCMPGQYRVFPPLAVIIAARRRGMLAIWRCRRSTRISAHLSSRAWGSSPRFWGGFSILVIVRPNSFQICFMGLQSGHLAGCSTTGLPEHGEVWRYRLGSGRYPRNAAWQIALRCFAKRPCRAHWWCICRGVQEAIWHHCEKLHWRVPNHHFHGPISLASLLEALTR